MVESANGSSRGVALEARMLHPLAEGSMLYLFQVYALVITIAAVPLVALYVTAAAYHTVSVKLARMDGQQHGPLRRVVQMLVVISLFTVAFGIAATPRPLDEPRHVTFERGTK